MPSPKLVEVPSSFVYVQEALYNRSYSGKSRAGVFNGQCSTRIVLKDCNTTSGKGATSRVPYATGEVHPDSVTYASKIPPPATGTSGRVQFVPVSTSSAMGSYSVIAINHIANGCWFVISRIFFHVRRFPVAPHIPAFFYSVRLFCQEYKSAHCSLWPNFLVQDPLIR